MLIQNYGLFWKEDDVFWGAGNKAGALYGVRSTAVTDEWVHFREQSGIYTLYAEYDLIYVGQAGVGNQKLFDRLKQHRRDALAERWNRFSWFGIRWVKADYELSAESETKITTLDNVLNHIEGILIHAAEPRHNRQGGRFGENVEQFLQRRDENLGLTQEEMIKELWDNRKTKR